MRAGLVLGVVLGGCTAVLGLDAPEKIELGALCHSTTGSGGDPALCSAAPACLTLDGQVDWCSAPCGTTLPPSGSQSPIPPDDGDSRCQMFASSGTPACGIADESDSTRITWYCEILCGTLAGQELGICPSGLRCIDNICR